MRRLGITTLTSALLALPACIIDHDLGQTAEGGSSGDAPSDGTTDSGVDPSATSGELPPTTSGDDSTSDGSTSDDGSDSSGTDGDPSCEPGTLYVDWAEDQLQPLPGLELSTVAVLGGECSLVDTVGAEGKRGSTWLWEFTLDCSLSGRLDFDAAVIDLPASIVLQGTSGMPLAEWLPPFGDQPLQLRVVIDSWGWGWNRYLVLHRGDDVMLDLVDAERVDPRDGGWSEDIDALLGDEPWHDTLAVGVVDAECSSASGKCGQSPRGLEIGWQESSRFAVIHDDQQAAFGSTVRELFYQAWVSAAQDITMPLCTDQPLGDYRLAIWGMEP